ncbi:UNVERIFIED_CONTAM: hypothetical protein Sradi_5114300 [Sesamum radiatum]|uniref:DUF4283 domain-containing protein n=1 Tax=Sesamum radiatum TaxID=300843 RepID=A0AAW2M4J9_SESRA
MPDCFEFNEDGISLTPVWVTLPSLPLECWHPNTLGKIGSRLGTPIAMDSLTMKMKKSRMPESWLKLMPQNRLLTQWISYYGTV